MKTMWFPCVGTPVVIDNHNLLGSRPSSREEWRDPAIAPYFPPSLPPSLPPYLTPARCLPVRVQSGHPTCRRRNCCSAPARCERRMRRRQPHGQLDCEQSLYRGDLPLLIIMNDHDNQCR